MKETQIDLENLVALIGGENRIVKVIELEKNYELNGKSYEFVDYYCRQNISSLKGRIEGSKSLISSTYKIPIVLDEVNGTILFYTRSYKHDNACWFVLDKIYSYREDTNGVEITLINNKKIHIMESFHVFDEQYSKALKLKVALDRKKRPIYV